MAADQGSIRELVRLLREAPAESTKLSLAQGVVLSVEEDTCTVVLNGYTSGVSGIRWLRDAYYPQPFDTVWLIRNGADKWILGKTTGSSAMQANFSNSLTSTLAVNSLSLPNATWTPATYGPFSIHAKWLPGAPDPSNPPPLTSSAGEEVTIHVTGIYEVIIQGTFATAGSGARQSGIDLGEASPRLVGSYAPAGGAPTAITAFSPLYILSPNTVLKFPFLQSSGGTISLTSGQIMIRRAGSLPSA